jgi:GAF domain-containing protein
VTIARRTVLLAGLMLGGPARAQAEQDLARIMAGLAAVRERRSAFTEEKAIPELDLPLPSEGTLRWTAPDRLEKHTVWPIDERVSVAGRRLVYERPDRGIRREIALEEQPEMAALVEAIRGTLAGDLPALRRHYEVEFGTRRDGSWRMELVPISLRLRSAVQRIVITGAGAEIRTVDTDGNGGVTRMRIAPAP